jgi:hypothetical protein
MLLIEPQVSTAWRNGDCWFESSQIEKGNAVQIEMPFYIIFLYYVVWTDGGKKFQRLNTEKGKMSLCSDFAVPLYSDFAVNFQLPTFCSALK